MIIVAVLVSIRNVNLICSECLIVFFVGSQCPKMRHRFKVMRRVSVKYVILAWQKIIFDQLFGAVISCYSYASESSSYFCVLQVYRFVMLGTKLAQREPNLG